MGHLLCMLIVLLPYAISEENVCTNLQWAKCYCCCNSWVSEFRTKISVCAHLHSFNLSDSILHTFWSIHWISLAWKIVYNVIYHFFYPSFHIWGCDNPCRIKCWFRYTINNHTAVMQKSSQHNAFGKLWCYNLIYHTPLCFSIWVKNSVLFYLYETKW